MLSSPLGFLYQFSKARDLGWNWTGVEGQSSHHLRWSELSYKQLATARNVVAQYQIQAYQPGRPHSIGGLHIELVSVDELNITTQDSVKERLAEQFRVWTDSFISQSEFSWQFPKAPQLRVDELRIEKLQLGDLGVFKDVRIQKLRSSKNDVTWERMEAQTPWGALVVPELKFSSSSQELQLSQGLTLADLKILGRISPETVFLDFEFWGGRLELSRSDNLVSLRLKDLSPPEELGLPKVSKLNANLFRLKSWSQAPDELSFDWGAHTWSFKKRSEAWLLTSPTAGRAEWLLPNSLPKLVSPFVDPILGRQPASTSASWARILHGEVSWENLDPKWVLVDRLVEKSAPQPRRKKGVRAK
jgi:hypothetical protein